MIRYHNIFVSRFLLLMYASCSKRMCSLSSTERKRTRRWLPCAEKSALTSKKTGAPLKTSRFGPRTELAFGSRSPFLGFRITPTRRRRRSGLGFWPQMSPTTLRFAALSPWIYRWVIESEECPAISCTSRSDPPASVIFFATAVMNVLLPECEDALASPISRYRV